MPINTRSKDKTVEFTMRSSLETRQMLHKLAKGMKRSANLQLVFMIQKEYRAKNPNGDIPPK